MPEYTLTAQILSADGEVLAFKTATFHVHRHHWEAELAEEVRHLEQDIERDLHRLHHHENDGSPA